MVDYWIPQVVVTKLPRVEIHGDGMGKIDAALTYTRTVYLPSRMAQNLRMLAHFRALDRDDD